MTGTIKHLSKQGSGGFIEPDGKGRDIFFPRSVLKGSAYEHLHPGDRVLYETEEDPRWKAVEASEVELIE